MLYRHRDEEDAASMALPVIAKGKLLPGMSVLDMGCGRGRHAGIFDREGLRVTGIDLSAECIMDAASSTPNAHFEVFDIRKPYATARFDAVVCLFTCLGYSDDRADDERAVAAAAQALKPNGLFVLDLLNGDLIARNLVPLETRQVDNVIFRIGRMKEGSDIVKHIAVEQEGHREEFEERVHAWAGAEVLDLVTRAGFAIEDITDGTCKAPFDSHRSERIVVWARKTT